MIILFSNLQVNAITGELFTSHVLKESSHVSFQASSA